MSEPSKEESAARDQVRLMTNLELWQRLLHAAPAERGSDEYVLVEGEFEWRLRKIGFLPAIPPEGLA